ncbi:Cation-chloride cotransporter 1 [Abeliophyllum distichum]|uniref:Cation-chloride cotransporter 1 n=1 Tax=Abeliophyllum distichum TaxID=126358 RepID=A0ABD1RVQ9_9LAMI
MVKKACWNFAGKMVKKTERKHEEEDPAVLIYWDYHERAGDAKEACKVLSTYIDYKRCEDVAPSMSDGFQGIVQTMGLDNLKPNIVVMRYPEIWSRENLTEISTTFVRIINDCIVANKAVVILKGLDKWPNEYQR